MSSTNLVGRCTADPALATLLEFACELADLASHHSLEFFRQPVAVSNKLQGSGFDPVTVADQRTEKAIRERIAQQWPGHAFLGEETGTAGEPDGYCWVVDPIDGTRAFITGLPLWGTLIALASAGQPLLGLMDQPYLKERYLGGPQGAVCVQDGQPVALQTRHCQRVDEAIMLTTDPSMFQHDAEIHCFGQLKNAVRMARFGGDCYAYAMLARGHVDLVVEAELEPYDIQAMMPIVSGAGGVVSDWRGNSAAAGGQVVAAATAELHAEALEYLRPAAQ